MPLGHIIASNIVDFHLTPILMNSEGTIFRVPGDVEVRMKGKSVEVDGGSSASLPIDSGTRIHSFEVALTVISVEGQVLMEESNLPLEEFVLKHGRRFTQNVTVY